ncbi:MAG: hypothetical protein KAS17_00010 [Victivallaceae bacterium]|nr:hypothetical protein [Victivallaceae bacterium]
MPTGKPDRLNYSTKANQLLKKIDDDNYMGLGRGITRSELFLFAMSLGVETESYTEVVNPYTGGLILDKSIDGKTQASMYSQFISLLEDPKNNLDAIDNKSQVYKMAEEYANAGFEMIAYYLDNNKPEDLVWDLLLELDAQYDEHQK